MIWYSSKKDIFFTLYIVKSRLPSAMAFLFVNTLTYLYSDFNIKFIRSKVLPWTKSYKKSSLGPTLKFALPSLTYPAFFILQLFLFLFSYNYSYCTKLNLNSYWHRIPLILILAGGKNWIALLNTTNYVKIDGKIGGKQHWHSSLELLSHIVTAINWFQVPTGSKSCLQWLQSLN